MTKLTLFFGGIGSEHEVSIMSAHNVVAAIDKAEYKLQLVYITKSGKWFEVENVDDLDDLSNELKPAGINADVIFPLIHGVGGEDGTLAALGQIMNIPVVGCGVEASTVAWDKDICKIFLSANKIPVVPWLTWRLGDEINYAAITSKLGSKTLFVKPARQGSSVGVGRVQSEEELANIVNMAFEYDDKILIEKAIAGRELECAVLGNKQDAQASCIGEVMTGENFYTYDEKYSNDSHSLIHIPADMPEDVSDRIRTLAVKAFRVIDGNGLSRVDFFLSNDGEIFLNEINTMPGFTNISMYPKLWQASGVEYGDLIDRLIKISKK